MSSEHTVELTNDNFESEITQHSGTSLVDFWAPWCGPCRMVSPIVEKIAKDYSGKLKVGKLNTDEAPMIAAQFGIRSIPTLILFKNGEVVDQVVGALPEDAITEKIDKVL